MVGLDNELYKADSLTELPTHIKNSCCVKKVCHITLMITQAQRRSYGGTVTPDSGWSTLRKATCNSFDSPLLSNAQAQACTHAHTHTHSHTHLPMTYLRWWL